MSIDYRDIAVDQQVIYMRHWRATVIQVRAPDLIAPPFVRLQFADGSCSYHSPDQLDLVAPLVILAEVAE